jgi:hydroxymethylglutaryl-CoA synthase
MTVGIHGLGLHVPRWRVGRQALAEAWGHADAGGCRSVANADEDVVTMGVAAALDALREDAGQLRVDAVLFATTSPVFAEGSHAAIVAEALGMSPRLAVDVGSTLRGGLDALQLAAELVRGGSASGVLVVAADRRELPPGSVHERNAGDCAAAVLVAAGPGMLTLVGSSTVVDHAAGIWRCSGQPNTQLADERFVERELLQPWLVRAAEQMVLDTHGLVRDDISQAVLASALPRCGPAAAAQLGLAATNGDSVRLIGFCGVAQPFVQLIEALRKREADERIVVAAAGDGATAVLVRVTDPAGFTQAVTSLNRALRYGRELSASAYQRLRGQLPVESVVPWTSPALLRREQGALLGLIGSRCRKCGALSFPTRRICANCHTIDDYDSEQLPRRGTLFTHTVEHLYPGPLHELIMGVVELGDVRFYTQITDAVVSDCVVGAQVELAFRRLHDGAGFPHYFWKAVPSTEEPDDSE